MRFSRLARAFGALVMGAALAAGIASAQTDGPFGGFKHDNSQPIEITADSLEVVQAKSQAVFTGDVIAGQGTLRMNADRLVVTYSTEGSADGQTGAIKHIRAEGEVFLSNGTETAKGAWADYDVATGHIRMGGGVVLTQGCNAISSNSLFIDLTQGVGRSEGEVKVIFTPEAETCG